MKFSTLSFFLFLVIAFQIKLVAADGSLAPQVVPGAITINTVTAVMLHEKDHLFIDVRGLKDFETGHIPGAKHFPVSSDNFSERHLQDLADKDQLIVFYCNGVTCMGSSVASEKAVNWGWKQIAYYRAGFPDWKEQGLAVE